MKSINQFGDQIKPTGQGCGVDITSQRHDELDSASLDYIRSLAATGRRITALDLVGGYGSPALW